jgi:hypothetical protein
MANPESSSPSNEVSDVLRADLRKQLRAEIDGEPITNPQRFALEMKYGLTDPVFTVGELADLGISALVEATNVR